MSDPLSWSISLGRWGGTRYRAHASLVLFAAVVLLRAAWIKDRTHPALETLVWLGLLGLALAVRQAVQASMAARVGLDREEVRIWPLGELCGPVLSPSERSSESILVVFAGILTSFSLAVGLAAGLAMSGAHMILNPFAALASGGAPTIKNVPVSPFTPLWYLGWFGFWNWVLFLGNLIVALPMDAGKIFRAVLSTRSKDGMIGPWTAHVMTFLLVMTGLARWFYQKPGWGELFFLAITIEWMVRLEARMLDEGGFFDEGVFGYDFSQGYTSLGSRNAHGPPLPRKCPEAMEAETNRDPPPPPGRSRSGRRAEDGRNPRKASPRRPQRPDRSGTALPRPRERQISQKSPRFLIMATGRFAEALRNRTFLVLDAAMGTRLMARGLDLATDDPSLWCLDRPDEVFRTHLSDVAAGSQVVFSNSFGANRFWLDKFGRSGDLAAINRQAVRLAREAVGPDGFVVGSIGPTASDGLLEQAKVLLKAGADGLILETQTAPTALAGLRAIRAQTSLPILVSLCSWPENLEEAVQNLVAEGADVVGTNCGIAPENILPPSQALVRLKLPVPLMAKPSGWFPADSFRGPDEFGAVVAKLKAMGIGLIGGCCGTDARYVQTIASLGSRHDPIC